MRTLPVPALLWCSVMYFLRFFMDRAMGEPSALGLRSWFDTCTGSFLWFLWSAFGASIVLLLAERCGRAHRAWEVVILIGGLGAMYILPNAELNLFVYPYFAVGYLLARRGLRPEQFRSRRAGLWGSGVAAVFIVLLCFRRREYSVYISGVSPWKSEFSWQWQL